MIHTYYINIKSILSATIVWHLIHILLYIFFKNYIMKHHNEILKLVGHFYDWLEFQQIWLTKYSYSMLIRKSLTKISKQQTISNNNTIRTEVKSQDTYTSLVYLLNSVFTTTHKCKCVFCLPLCFQSVSFI